MPAKPMSGDVIGLVRRLPRVGVGAWCRRALLAAGLPLALATLPGPSHATEDFAKQTKQPCSACHTKGYPLTPFGKAFRANNYKLPPCKPATIRLYDRRGVFVRTFRGCFPTRGPKVTIGQ